MAFKIKKNTFDFDLEITLINGETEIIKCVKSVSIKVYQEYMAFITKQTGGKSQEELVEESKKDIVNSFITVIKSIDFFYEKGTEWWETNVDPSLLLEIQAHLNDYATSMRKKK